jgi:hypothetical protein
VKQSDETPPELVDRWMREANDGAKTVKINGVDMPLAGLKTKKQDGRAYVEVTVYSRID